MSTFTIRLNDQIKEKFDYEISFNETTQYSIVEYARAKYGPDALVFDMTDKEHVKPVLQKSDIIQKSKAVTR